MSPHHAAMAYDQLVRGVLDNYIPLEIKDRIFYVPKVAPEIGGVHFPTIEDVRINQAGHTYRLVEPTEKQLELFLEYIGAHGQEPGIKNIVDMLVP